MVDDRILRRIDWFLTVLTVWLLLSLVVASLALLVVDVAVGLVALATVVLTSVTVVVSYRRSSGASPPPSRYSADGRPGGGGQKG